MVYIKARLLTAGNSQPALKLARPDCNPACDLVEVPSPSYNTSASPNNLAELASVYGYVRSTLHAGARSRMLLRGPAV